MKIERKNKLPMIILMIILMIIIFVVLGNLNKILAVDVDGVETNRIKCEVPMDVEQFYSSNKIDNKNLYVYCANPDNHLGNKYTSITKTTLDTKYMKIEDITSNSKIIKEAYIMQGETKVEKNDFDAFSAQIKTLNTPGKQKLATYLIKLLCSPRQIAIWKLEKENIKENINYNYDITKYTVLWDLEGYNSYFGFRTDYDNGHVYQKRYPNDTDDATTKDLAAGVESLFSKNNINSWTAKNTTSATKLVSDANAFYDKCKAGKKGIERITNGLSTPSVDYSKNDNIYIGPFKITYNDTIKAEVLDNQNNKIPNIKFAKKIINNYISVASIPNNAEFYLEINKNNMPASINTIRFTGKYKYYKITNYELSSPSEKQQLLAAGKYDEYKEDCILDIKPNITLVPKLTIDITKKNQLENTLTGATFTVKFMQNGKILTSQGNTVQPVSTSTVRATITETKAPAGYAKLSKPIIIDFNYENSQWKGTITSMPELEKNGIKIIKTEKNNAEIKVTVEVIDLFKIDHMQIIKKDQKGKLLSGAEFEIEEIENATIVNPKPGDKYTTDANGIIDFGEVVIKDITKKVTLKLKETKAPTGYYPYKESMIVTFERKNNGLWMASYDGDALLGMKIETDDNGTTAQITIKDLYKIDALLINKIDPNGNAVNGAEFTATITSDNAYFTSTDAGVGNSISGKEPKEMTLKSENGKIRFGEIVVRDNKDIEIELKEISTPKGYKKLNGTIKIKIICEGKANYTVTATLGDEELETVVENNVIGMSVENIPMMLVGGMVFNDIATGEDKNGNKREQNGKFDRGEELAGVKVDLLDSKNNIVATTYSSEGETVKYTSYTGEEKEKILAKGEYFFSAANGKDYLDLDKYKVQFTYNGQKFTTTAKTQNLYNEKTSEESKVDEQGRTDFNEKFKTITEGTADSGGSISYTSTKKQNVEGVNDANLIMYEGNYSWDAKGNNTEADVLDLYQIKAVTPANLDMTKNWQDVWNDNGTANDSAFQLDINCGLRERRLDLSLIADVDNTEVKINGKSTSYSYAQMLDGSLNNLGEKKSDDVENYNQMIYESDYNFRLTDYEKGLISVDANKSTNGEDIKNLKNSSNQLEIYVTYTLEIKRQIMTEDGKITVDEVKDYYDPNTYEYEYDPSTSNNVTYDKKNGELTISNLGTIVKGGDDTLKVDLKFKVIIPEDKKAGEVLCTGINKAEITKYSTEDGLIDRDSAPGNANLNSENENYEDDTDLANGIEYSLTKDTTRTISGYVWDDSRTTKEGKYTIGDGLFDNNEEKIDDVLVQLIELKTIKLNDSDYTLEYIWQETRSGSNEVVGINVANTEISTYYNEIEIEKEKDKGKYKFTGFIPGDYIVRFIYGDGSVVETDTEGNTKTSNSTKYNGQDYKSTQYDNYNSIEYYNMKEDLNNENIKSVARDNEARRLEVMAYSATIDNTIGSAIAEKTVAMLNNTWMCAETLKINVPVDALDLKTDSDENAAIGSSSGTGNTFDKINFGLELRPKTKLVLEKHITGLKVTPTAGATLLDATASIADILTDKDTKNGVTKGLSTIVSTRGNRGFWKLETDLEELAQGANVEVTYTYVVKNEGDEDYLSKELVQAYKDKIGKNINANDFDDYVDYLKEKVTSATKQAVRDDIGTYLGKYYYSGKDEDKGALVPTRAEKIEEALNNQLSLDNSTLETINKDFTKVVKDEGAYYNDLENSSKEEFNRKVWRDNGSSGVDPIYEKMNTIVKTNNTNFLVPKEGLDNQTENDLENVDYNKTLTLNTTLASVSTDSAQLTFASYIAEITKYTNAAGRADMKAVPENLTYVHSDDNERTLDTVPNDDYYKGEKSNEYDEFWGESVIISKPTGQDKLTPIQITAITTAAVAIVGVGIVLIKKYVIK